MNFNSRTFKDRHNNYASMSQLKRNFAHSYEDNQRESKVKEMSVQLSSSLPYLRGKENQQNYMQSHRLDMLEQRVEMLERNKAENQRQSRFSSLPQSPSQQSQVSVLKQSISSDLHQQREQLKMHSIRWEQLHSRQIKLQQELKNWLSDQRQEVNFKLMSQNEELRGHEYSKQMKNDQQIEMMRSALQNFQQKWDEDRQKRIKTDAYLRDGMHRQILGVKEELTKMVKSEKDQTSRVLRQLKQTFGSLKNMLETDREQVKEAISQVQFTSEANISKLSKVLQNVSQNFQDKTNKNDKRFTTLKHEWQQFKINIQQQLQENKSAIMNFENHSIDRMQRDFGSSKVEEFEQMKQEFTQWKELTQQKNLNVFRQMANAMKSMRLEWKQQNQNLGKEIMQVAKTIKDVKKNSAKQIKKEVQQVVNVLTEEFDALTDEIEQVNELVAVAKRETDKKIEDCVKNELSEMKTYLNSVMKNANKSIEDTNASIAQMKEQTAKSAKQNSEIMKKFKEQVKNNMEQIDKKITNDIEQIRKHTQQNLDTFVETLNHQNEQWAASINTTIANIRTNVTKQLQTSKVDQDKKAEELTKKVENKLAEMKGEVKKKIEETKQAHKTVMDAMKKLEEDSNKIDAKIVALNTEVGKKIETGSEATKKNVEKAIAAERTQNAKNLAKTSDELTKLITDSSGKWKKERQAIQLNIKQSMEKVSASTALQLQNFKTSYDGKIAEVQKITKNSQSQNKKHEEQLKARTVEIEKRFIDSMGKVKSQMATEITKGKAATIEEINKIKVDLESKMKAVEQQKSKKEQQIKAKEEELKAKESKESQLSRKIADLQKKMDSSLSSTKKDLEKVVTDNLAKTKIELEQKMASMLKDSNKKQFQKMETALTSTKKDIQKNINDSNSKIKGQIDQKVASSIKENNKKQTERINVVIASTKKDLQKLIADSSVKTKTQIEQNVASMVKQTSKKQAQIKAKESQSDMKFQAMIVNLQKEWKAEQAKDKKIINEQISKIHQESKKNNGNLHETQKSVVLLKADFDKKLEDVTHKSQLTSTQRQQDQIDHLRAQFRKQLDSKLPPLNKKLADIGDECQTLQLIISEVGKQTKEIVNKLEGKVFSESQKHKVMFSKFNEDMGAVTEDLMLIMSQMKIAKD